ncbi:hypothetical protein [Caballeronia glebae]|uniref:hypothetical protein n=1 Tax=Caballeronia glebae TaxID=1777143 RepID=UPI0038B90253
MSKPQGERNARVDRGPRRFSVKGFNTVNVGYLYGTVVVKRALWRRPQSERAIGQTAAAPPQSADQILRIEIGANLN